MQMQGVEDESGGEERALTRENVTDPDLHTGRDTRHKADDNEARTMDTPDQSDDRKRGGADNDKHGLDY